MALVLKSIYLYTNYVLVDLPDPRANELFLANSIFYPIFINLLYLYFVFEAGPQFMKKRKPFDLDKILVAYNAIQVALCLFITVEAFKIVLTLDWRCAEVDYSNSEQALYVMKLVWGYYLIKVFDLLDTVFFVLRKRDKQVTFLHTYHHGGMVILTYVGIRYLAGGHSVYMGIINCVVHAIMYFYYLLTAYDKELKKSLWWKKHITQLQIAQFSSFFVIYGQLLFRKNCKFPVATQIIFLPQVAIMTILFVDFYYKTYIRKPEKNNFAVIEKSKASSSNGNTNK